MTAGILRRWQLAAAANTARVSGVIVFGVAFALRVLVPLTGGGLVGNYSYDAGVYYTAGAALVHGRLPYRDFILLHPPGVALAVAPAAWIGRHTSVHIGFAAAVLEFIAIGAISAVLVVVVARGFGAPLWAATAGGLFYAVWFLSVRAEYLSRLEPLGNLFMLCGLIGYVRTAGQHSRRWALLCGAALGAAVSVKIWYAVPLVVVLCFLATRRNSRTAGWTVLGAVSGIVLICGPFFALAPTSMWRMVVSEQIGRGQTNAFRALVTLQRLPPGISWSTAYLLDAVIVVAVGLLFVTAWGARAVRLPLTLLMAGGVVLLAAPSWFLFYADYLTPAAALCVATGAAAVASSGADTASLYRCAGAAVGAAVVILVIAGSAMALWYRPGKTTSPPRELASALTKVRCVMSDSPMALISLNALDRDLANGCPDWVDVTGRTYASDMTVHGPDGRPLPRVENGRWQQALADYLRSGQAVIVARAKDAGISGTTFNAIRGGGVLAAAGSDVIYAVPQCHQCS
jgi:hypothetical protein